MGPLRYLDHPLRLLDGRRETRTGEQEVLRAGIRPMDPGLLLLQGSAAAALIERTARPEADDAVNEPFFVDPEVVGTVE